MNVTVIGYLGRETSILPDGQTVTQAGGPALYTAAALSRIGATTDVVTWMPEEDADLLAAFDPYPVNIHVLAAERGVTAVHDFRTPEPTAGIMPSSLTLAPELLNDETRTALAQSDLVHLAPDRGETVTLPTIQFLSNDLGLRISADLRPYLTVPDADGRLQSRHPWPDHAAYIRYFDTVFLDEAHIAPLLAAGESVLSVARMISEQGPNEIVMTHGATAAFIYQRDTNEGFSIPAYPPKRLVDPTGTGDTFIGAYLGARYASDTPIRAARIAAMASRLKLAYSGPLRETAEDIERQVNELEEQHPQESGITES